MSDGPTTFVVPDPDGPETARRLTDTFLEQEPLLHNRIADLVSAYRQLGDLIPQTMAKFGSGHFFPFAESEFELANSYLLVQRAFYRHALVGLRSVLELGLLSVYWDRHDRAEDVIAGWVTSVEPTPFKKEILSGLFSMADVQEFDRSCDLRQLIDRAYGQLSNFTHVRGFHHSSSSLNRANFVQFDADSLRRWAASLDDVIPIVVILHLLKYPIGLQETPLDQKFGLNGPAGGFLNPWQADRLRAVLKPPHLDALQRISDANEDAVQAAEAIRNLSDISSDQFHEQIIEFDKDLIRSQGYERWHASQMQLYESEKALNPDSYAAFEARAARLLRWAKDEKVTGDRSTTDGDVTA